MIDIGKKGVNGVTEPRWEIGITHEFDLKVTWKVLGFK